ncbi:hypothetical protein BCR33DRAFT_112021 [Rhizoclosmatium globosum]|uniref:Uncharacterized protein n=1 Tax=Rhizoclosmatium globosum TaxID=329046 RepID=A0A1Y2CIQ0_9FUNG|nr:hypothetical protein BCR33DRAFT_112021 [Rhizoclosmatium globosum]|eukprot:ORY46892.1 hypothetical protein BCR33DRAFT_112021 [Rhizoclosmatium globosum]
MNSSTRSSSFECLLSSTSVNATSVVGSLRRTSVKVSIGTSDSATDSSAGVVSIELSFKSIATNSALATSSGVGATSKSNSTATNGSITLISTDSANGTNVSEDSRLISNKSTTGSTA